MAKTDNKGNSYASLSALKFGDYVMVDGSFTCLRKDEICQVEADIRGQLFIRCSGHGDFANRSRHRERNEQHFLSGQLDDDGNLIGIYSAKPKMMNP